MRTVWRAIKRGLFLLAIIVGGAIASILLLGLIPDAAQTITSITTVGVLIATPVVLGLVVLIGIISLVRHGRLPR
jgi:hypothetical protein